MNTSIIHFQTDDLLIRLILTNTLTTETRFIWASETGVRSNRFLDDEITEYEALADAPYNESIPVTVEHLVVAILFQSSVALVPFEQYVLVERRVWKANSL